MTTFLKQIAPVWTPHKGQRAFLTHKSRFKVLACGRRWGKTDASAIQVLQSLLSEKPTRHLILAPTLDQAKLLFERVLDLLHQLLDRRPDLDGGAARPEVRRSPYPRMKFNGHTVHARSGHLGRSLRGNEATHIIVDEAAFVPEELITEVAMPMLATTNGSITLISTPRGLNHFWRFFQMGKKREHGVWSRQAPSSESPFVSAQYLELQRSVISSRAFRTEYEAMFAESEGRVFRTELIDSALVPSLATPIVGPYFIGIDWARYSDSTAVVVLNGSRKGSQLLHAEAFQEESWSATADRAASIIRRFPGARVLTDGTGLGDPLYEMLKDRVFEAGIESFLFTAPSKSALIDQLVGLFESDALRMQPHPDLIRELQHFEAVQRPSGTPKLGAAQGYHDDLVIALALAAKLLPPGEPVRLQLGGERVFSARALKRGPIPRFFAP